MAGFDLFVLFSCTFFSLLGKALPCSAQIWNLFPLTLSQLDQKVQCSGSTTQGAISGPHKHLTVHNERDKVSKHIRACVHP